MQLVTPTDLLEYMDRYGIQTKRLSELCGVTGGFLSSALNRSTNRHGHPTKLAHAALEKINRGINALAEEIGAMQVTPDMDNPKQTSRGTYYPNVLPQLAACSHCLKMTPFICTVLGWNKMRKANVFNPHSNIHGYITADDCRRLNNAFQQIARDLTDYQLIADPSDDKDTSSST